ncbi:unnamed protein product [Rangifer tarandus platyrhynchus]|uniref:Uncharacterized protein n=1 Tax=Rangifer tarandus platyrhynchus TaxID=3082113 RepID=A0AC59Z8L3_RANTA
MATLSSVLAWRIPWAEEHGRLQSTGSQTQTCLSTGHTGMGTPPPPPAPPEQSAVRKQMGHWAAAAPRPGTAPAHSTTLLLADIHATGTDVVQSRVQLQAVSFVSMQQ